MKLNKNQRKVLEALKEKPMTTAELYELITGEKEKHTTWFKTSRKWATVKLIKLEKNNLIKYDEKTKKWHIKQQNLPPFLWVRKSMGIWDFRPLYCSDCGKRLSEEEIKNSKKIIGKPLCKRCLNRKMDW